MSSSRLTIPSLPDGVRCCGQTSQMWSTVCSGAPHSQTEESLRPHFSMAELNRPTPMRRRLRVVHCFRGKSRPGTLCGSRISCAVSKEELPASPEPGLLRHAWGRQIAEMMGLLGEGATSHCLMEMCPAYISYTSQCLMEMCPVLQKLHFSMFDGNVSCVT